MKDKFTFFKKKRAEDLDAQKTPSSTDIHEENKEHFDKTEEKQSQFFTFFKKKRAEDLDAQKTPSSTDIHEENKEHFDKTEEKQSQFIIFIKNNFDNIIDKLKHSGITLTASALQCDDNIIKISHFIYNTLPTPIRYIVTQDTLNSFLLENRYWLIEKLGVENYNNSNKDTEINLLEVKHSSAQKKLSCKDN